MIFRGSIGRTDFPYGDHDALIRAIKTKLFPLGDDIALSRHGGMGTFGMDGRAIRSWFSPSKIAELLVPRSGIATIWLQPSTARHAQGIPVGTLP